MKVHNTPCPCDPARSYAKCCERFHSGLHAGVNAPDAESLMRSRYSAYVLQLSDYLMATWHADTRPTDALIADATTPKWIHLDIRRYESTGEHSAIVEFIARYRLGGRAERMHELSRFVEEDGRWYYVDGDQLE